jgi:hypothetical protein
LNVHAFAITAELPTAQEIFVSMDLTMIRRLYPAAALPDIRSALADVADAGMGTFARDVFSECDAGSDLTADRARRAAQ